MSSQEEVYSELSVKFCEHNAQAAARVLEQFSEEESALFFKGKPINVCSLVLEHLSPLHAAALLTRLDGERLNQILAEGNLNGIAVLISQLEEAQREQVLAHLDAEYQKDIREFLSYPPGCAGGLMDTRVAAFRSDDSIALVSKRLREFRDRRVHNIFVVDANGMLTGKVSLQDIALAEPEEAVGKLADPSPPRVDVFSPQEEVVGMLNSQQLSSIPVVNFEGRLLGVLRNQTLLQAAQEEARSDVQAMFGAGREERALSPVLFAVKKRLPWLEINLLTAFLAASVVGMFEATIAQFTALAILLPVVAGQSGNTGAQALAVTMRGLAVREIRVRQWLRVVWKEVNVAIINGVAVALTTALGVFVWSGSLGLALVIGVSMVISMAAAGASGAAVPIVLTSIGQDPAQSSSIILTTITDVVGFFSFLGIATLLMAML